MEIKTRKILPKVLSLTFENCYELAMSFVRFQENYESPEFRNKYFTLEEFMDYWAREQGKGSFDYPVRWSGFNIPGKILKDWVNHYGITEREKEEELLDKILTRYDFEELSDIYIVGVSKDSPNRKRIVDHEVAHAMYTLYPKYKKSCSKLLTKLRSTPVGDLIYKGMEEELLKMGYCEEVIEDEMQAYWSVPENYALHDTCETLMELESNYRKYRKEICN